VIQLIKPTGVFQRNRNVMIGTMPRARLYESNAERQAAYRARLASRPLQATAVNQIGELETALAWMTKRALAAEERAVQAEHRATAADNQVMALKLSLAGVQHQLEQSQAANSEAPTSPNRQARRQAERDARRRRR
jgi:hypothetical protein